MALDIELASSTRIPVYAGKVEIPRRISSASRGSWHKACGRLSTCESILDGGLYVQHRRSFD